MVAGCQLFIKLRFKLPYLHRWVWNILVIGFIGCYCATFYPCNGTYRVLNLTQSQIKLLCEFSIIVLVTWFISLICSFFLCLYLYLFHANVYLYFSYWLMLRDKWINIVENLVKANDRMAGTLVYKVLMRAAWYFRCNVSTS